MIVEGYCVPDALSASGGDESGSFQVQRQSVDPEPTPLLLLRKHIFLSLLAGNELQDLPYGPAIIGMKRQDFDGVLRNVKRTGLHYELAPQSVIPVSRRHVELNGIFSVAVCKEHSPMVGWGVACVIGHVSLVSVAGKVEKRNWLVEVALIEIVRVEVPLPPR